MEVLPTPLVYDKYSAELEKWAFTLLFSCISCTVSYFNLLANFKIFISSNPSLHLFYNKHDRKIQWSSSEVKENCYKQEVWPESGQTSCP